MEYKNLLQKTKRVQIKDLKTGMKIKSLNDDGDICYKEVLDVWQTHVSKDRQLIVEFENGAKLDCSDNHPIMVLRDGIKVEVEAQFLTSSDKVMTDSGYTYIKSVKEDSRDETYYDITVDETNTFFGASSEDGSMILQHNCSQGGIRGGAATVYYPWWHLEFPELIVLKNNSGTEESRERHVDYGVQVNNLLFERFLNDQDITLFSPHEVPALQDAFYRKGYEAFKREYELLESRTDIAKRKMSAKEVVHNLVNERQKTGRIYILFMDNVIQQAPFEKFKNNQWLTSNLCVAPETEILTDKGYVVIKDVVNTKATVWNGLEWSEVEVKKTGSNQKLLKVTMTTGETLDCTPYHKFYLFNRDEVRAQELKSGDALLSFETPEGEELTLSVDSVVDEGRVDDTYCFSEPKRHMGVFNGILTGQCIEIALPVTSFESLDDPDGHIALCTLSSANWGVLHKPTDLEKPCRSMVRALDNLLSYQEYPVEPAERFTKAYRALGVGIVGFAHFLAKRGLKYNINAAETVDEYMEAMAYYLIDESVRLAEERGSCEAFEDTCYARGVFPWEKRNKNIDKVVKHTLRYDWEELRTRLLKHGIRNATLMAIAPTESSSILLGETNGIEPPIFDIVEKKSKDGSLKQLVPEYHNLKNKYDYKWDQVDNKGYLLLMGILQKWVDQSISSNTNYNPDRFAKGKIPESVLVQDILFANQIGMKSLYYQNINDMAEDSDHVIEAEEVCETCVI